MSYVQQFDAQSAHKYLDSAKFLGLLSTGVAVLGRIKIVAPIIYLATN